MSDSASATSETPEDLSGPHAQGNLAALAVGAIGVVFGDIGTSPIYAFRETFAGHHELAEGPTEIVGVLSLIFWSMMIVVAIKYVSVIMRADNKGEGGSLALLALISRKGASEGRKWTTGIVLLGVFACALFYGDCMITPAISVLSAVEGLTTVEASFAPYVIPVAIGILVFLFAIQAHGTARVGTLFGPTHMSMLWGVVFFSHQLGSFLGGWGAGRLYDIQGNYDLMWWISVGLGLFAAVIHWSIRERPVPRLATAAT